MSKAPRTPAPVAAVRVPSDTCKKRLEAKKAQRKVIRDKKVSKARAERAAAGFQEPRRSKRITFGKPLTEAGKARRDRRIKRGLAKKSQIPQNN